MSTPVVTVKEGSLQGKRVQNVRGEYYSFQGIPYAKPPVGDLRFKDPQPPEPWVGIRDATKQRTPCMQHDLLVLRFVGSEDCLHLSVYTPQINNQNLKAVMVYVYGGAFKWGSASVEEYGPDHFMKEDVVLVTVNYRTGAFGFLRFDDPSLEVPGNAGLKDIIMALRWVNSNIKSFGGDPTNVTLFGHCSGGVMVHLLVLSPLTKGLISRAIMQSSSALAHWASLPAANRAASMLAKQLKIEGKNDKEILDKMRKVSAETLLRAQLEIDNYEVGAVYFTPVIEKHSGKFAVLTERPLDIIKSGNYNKIPLIFGYTSLEGVFLKESPRRLLPVYISDFLDNSTKAPALKKSIWPKIEEFYYGKDRSTMEEYDMLLLLGDILFPVRIHNSINLHLENTDKRIYLYRFSVDGKLNCYKHFLNYHGPGAIHGDELAYIFKNADFPDSLPDSVEDLTTRRMVKLWTNFAKYDDPNPREKSSLIKAIWQPVQKHKLHFLEIGDNLTVGFNPDEERMNVWKHLME